MTWQCFPHLGAFLTSAVRYLVTRAGGRQFAALSSGPAVLVFMMKPGSCLGGRWFRVAGLSSWLAIPYISSFFDMRRLAVDMLGPVREEHVCAGLGSAL
jgi:hypothetical protein